MRRVRYLTKFEINLYIHIRHPYTQIIMLVVAHIKFYALVCNIQN